MEIISHQEYQRRTRSVEVRTVDGQVHSSAASLDDVLAAIAAPEAHPILYVRDGKFIASRFVVSVRESDSPGEYDASYEAGIRRAHGYDRSTRRSS